MSRADRIADHRLGTPPHPVVPCAPGRGRDRPADAFAVLRVVSHSDRGATSSAVSTAPGCAPPTRPAGSPDTTSSRTSRSSPTATPWTRASTGIAPTTSTTRRWRTSRCRRCSCGAPRTRRSRGSRPSGPPTTSMRPTGSRCSTTWPLDPRGRGRALLEPAARPPVRHHREEHRMSDDAATRRARLLHPRGSDRSPPGDLVAEVREGEAMEIGHVFISERFNIKEAVTLSGAAGAVSERIAIATAATNHNTRHPLVTAAYAQHDAQPHRRPVHPRARPRASRHAGRVRHRAHHHGAARGLRGVDAAAVAR